MRDAPPEALVSRFAVTHAMVLNILSRGVANPWLDREPQDPVLAMRDLLAAVHETDAQKSAHVRQALRIARSLRIAGVVERIRVPDATHARGERPSLRLTVDVPRGFALNQPLSPFALAAMDLLNVEAPDHALDVVSVIESTLSDPRQILVAQQYQARGEAVAAMKADGIEYEERLALLDEVTWPQPLADLLEPAFIAYRRTNPWLLDAELSPKSVVRDMLEKAMSFGELISVYGLERTEGVVLQVFGRGLPRAAADRPRGAPHRRGPRDHHVAGRARARDGLVAARRVGAPHEPRRARSPTMPTRRRPSLPQRQPARCRETRACSVASCATSCSAASSSPRARTTRPLARSTRGGLDGARWDGARWDGNAWREALDPLFEAQGDHAIGIGPDARSAALLTFVEPGGDHDGGGGACGPCGHARWRASRGHVARAPGARRPGGRPRLGDRRRGGPRGLRRGGRARAPRCCTSGRSRHRSTVPHIGPQKRLAL